VTQSLLPPHQEMSYSLATEADATRLELTARWAEASMTDEPHLARSNMTAFVSSAVDHYKSITEGL
jgi:hypothetical protein